MSEKGRFSVRPISGNYAQMETQRTVRYEGSCHCGAVRFSFDGMIDQVRECDCSVCKRHGALTFRVERDALSFSPPLDELTEYLWGTRTGADYFCPKCGILQFRRPSQPTRQEQANGLKPFDGWAVNVRCIDELDLESLPRVPIEGSKIAF